MARSTEIAPCTPERRPCRVDEKALDVTPVVETRVHIRFSQDPNDTRVDEIDGAVIPNYTTQVMRIQRKTASSQPSKDLMAKVVAQEHVVSIPTTNNPGTRKRDPRLSSPRRWSCHPDLDQGEQCPGAWIDVGIGGGSGAG